METSKGITKEDLFNKVSTYLKNEKNIDLIKRAYYLAEKYHEGQFRKSGDPYIQHPLEVAYLLASLNASPQTVCAGLLHDVLEDTNYTSEQMIDEFGQDVYSIVEGVTKIGKLKYMTKERALARTHQKILLAMAKDIRVVLVKLLDRIHNMRTLEFQPLEKQVRIAQETLDLYAPLAHRLGMYRIKAELEDTAFKYIYPDRYQKITSTISKQKETREEDIDKMQQLITNLLKSNNIKDFQIKGRIKNIYSINHKMETKDLDLSQIYDLMALRVIVPTVADCYMILGLIHSQWNPLPGRFKDYIATPKPNLYQSLHTTILGFEGKIFEVQIRTYDMDNVAENGIAAHYSYKEENSNYSHQKEQEELVTKLKWYRDLLSYVEDDNDEVDPLNNIKEDIFSASVYVFTPKGDVLDFPNGATPLDFAYRVHTEVGNRTVGAIVNGRIVPLTYHLKTGDVIEIKTNKNFNGPSEGWLKIVKTSHAKSKIMGILNKRKRDQLIERGQEEFERTLKALNISLKIDEKMIKENFHKLTINSLDDFYYNLGKGEISARGAINKLAGTIEKFDENAMIKHYQDLDKTRRTPKTNDYAIYVDGLPKAQVKLASCCHPVYGDAIIGYVSKGNGIIVHRFECHNVKNSQEERFIDVYWDDAISNKHYESLLHIYSFDRKNIVAEIINTINGINNVNINSITSAKDRSGDLVTKVKISVNNLQTIANLENNLYKISDIHAVERVMK